MAVLPEKQSAIQLVGPDRLILNTAKDVLKPGPYQIVCRVEAVGLCFSDSKLLKQFASHVRKGPVLSGIDARILEEIPSYVPGERPTVPGHEAVVRIATVGEGVERFAVGQRYLVQTDYRWLRTAGSNAAFGYNFEGALQEYVLMDVRVITSPAGESMLIGVSDELSASAIAMVEPWACVENGYATAQRRRSKEDGRMLILAEEEFSVERLAAFFDRFGMPSEITWVSPFAAPEVHTAISRLDSIDGAAEESFDDVLYFGSNASTVEKLFSKVAANGLLNIVQCGAKFDRAAELKVGRFHYSCVRLTGTGGWDPADSMRSVPDSGEIRAGDKVHVIGAGGPMGLMHVIRAITLGVEGVSVRVSDIDAERLAALRAVAGPMAKNHNVDLADVSAGAGGCSESFDYTVIMAPVAALVSEAVQAAAVGGIINIFTGIAADVSAEIDLDAYIEKGLYFVGTSGSVPADMRTVLSKVESGVLDTNVCIDAVCGLDGVINGIRAIENRSIAGKIIVYPACRGLGLLPLGELTSVIGDAGKGRWSKAAEQALLNMYKSDYTA